MRYGPKLSTSANLKDSSSMGEAAQIRSKFMCCLPAKHLPVLLCDSPLLWLEPK